MKRIRQRDVLPSAMKYRLTQLYDANTNKYVFRADDNSALFTIDPVNKTLSLISPLTLASAITFSSGISFGSTVNITGLLTGANANLAAVTVTSLTSTGPVVASQFTSSGAVYAGGTFLLVGGGASGGTATSFFTNSGTYQFLNSSRFTINPANYPNAKFFLKALYRAGASGDPARTFFMSLWDVAANAQVTNSEISGTAQSTASIGGIPVLTGAVDFKPNLTTGNRDYVLAIKNDGSVNFIDLYAGFIVISS